MKETQALLTAYIEAKTAEIIRRKEDADIHPALATSLEILENIHEDTLECMRLLYRSGRFKGVRTLNNPALTRN